MSIFIFLVFTSFDLFFQHSSFILAFHIPCATISFLFFVFSLTKKKKKKHFFYSFIFVRFFFSFSFYSFIFLFQSWGRMMYFCPQTSKYILLITKTFCIIWPPQLKFGALTEFLLLLYLLHAPQFLCCGFYQAQCLHIKKCILNIQFFLKRICVLCKSPFQLWNSSTLNFNLLNRTHQCISEIACLLRFFLVP